MTREEKSKKLDTLPWQALYDTAIASKIDENEVKGCDKASIISKLIAHDITDDAVEALVNDYIYGNRVTFTLWLFDHSLTEPELCMLRGLSNEEEYYLDITGFRNLKVLSVNDVADRLEILYVYSKEYDYIDEGGKEASVWEQHRGCLWIGLNETYLACISKHEKMTDRIISFISGHIGNSLKQIKIPKNAIDNCTNPEAISRVVLQGTGGEKTTISRAGGITEEQEEEISRIRYDRFDTSGSYIAKVSEEVTATIKYNINRGSIGIYKHLSASELFSWTSHAIQVIMNEIAQLKGKPASEIFKEMGIELKWNSFDASLHAGLNTFLTQVIAALNYPEGYQFPVSECIQPILNSQNLFYKVPRVYCHKCDSYEIPVCGNCGKILKYMDGSLYCDCGAPLSITCSEHHNGCMEQIYWYIPKQRFISTLNKQISMIFKDEILNYNICVMNDTVNISFGNCANTEVEVPFSCIQEFSVLSRTPDGHLLERLIQVKEKCSATCSGKNIQKCLSENDMVCLPKLFTGVLPGFRPQPHGVKEYGDVSGQVTVGRNHYELKGIIKSNTENKKGKTLEDMLKTPLKSTAKAGEEIIRQFVEQGMNDSRCDLIAVIAPQFFDNGLKGTLRNLAKLGNKKVVFIELNEMCKIAAMTMR